MVGMPLRLIGFVPLGVILPLDFGAVAIELLRVFKVGVEKVEVVVIRIDAYLQSLIE